MNRSVSTIESGMRAPSASVTKPFLDVLRSALLHEAVFGGFILLVWLRLICITGFLSEASLWFGGLVATQVALMAWCGQHPGKARWCVRLLFFPVAMNISYFWLKDVGPRLHPGMLDAQLHAADLWLLGGNVSLWMQPFAHPVLTEFFSICYALFFPYMAFSWAYYLWQRDLALAKKFFAGFFTIYGIGFLGYTLVPAMGPHLDPSLAAQFTTPLTGGWVTAMNARIIAAGSNHVDCFPSLHCAISCYILCFDARHARWRFRLHLIPCIGLWISTLYLRYHYAVDVLAGFALSAACLWLVLRREPQTNPQP